MARWAEREIAGWGRYPRVTGLIARPETRRAVIEAMADPAPSPLLSRS